LVVVRGHRDHKLGLIVAQKSAGVTATNKQWPKPVVIGVVGLKPTNLPAPVYAGAGKE